MIDPDRWARLAFHLLEACADEDPDPTRSERAAVHLYAAIHHRLTKF